MERKISSLSRITCFMVAMVATACIVGCATTAPQARYNMELSKEKCVAAQDTVIVKIDPATDVSMVDYEKQRMAQRIVEKVNAFKLKNNGGSDVKQYSIDVRVKKYDKGNAFARAMLAGLGQMHIDALVAMYTLPENEKVTEFEISKTFAWGGIYGASTTMEDIEHGFAEGIAEAVTKIKKDE